VLAGDHKISQEFPEGFQKPFLDENINLVVLTRR
jgi:hypothetical protein